MKNKIIIEGQEFELPQSLVDEIKEKLREPEPKKVTYDDVIKELFHKGNPKNELCYYLERDEIENSGRNSTFTKEQNLISLATSHKQVEKLLAINKLMNVAKYLNGDYKYDKSKTNYKLMFDLQCNTIRVVSGSFYTEGNIYFKSAELAYKAIDILGEDVIKLALSTDY